MFCQRCRGLLVWETFYDLSITVDGRSTATRCINCGYIEDAVVRSNRVCASVSTQATLVGYDQLSSAHGVEPLGPPNVLLKRRNRTGNRRLRRVFGL